MSQQLQQIIDDAWDQRAHLSPSNALKDVTDAVDHVLDELDAGRLRVATRDGVGQWTVHQWVKKAVLLSFRLKENESMRAGDLGFVDKVPTKFADMDPAALRASGVRVVPPAVARRGSHIGRGVVLMPKLSIGAYVGDGTMVDTWATVGSCAQVGQHVHLSGGVGLGGVLGRCRPIRPSSRITASSARARRWSRRDRGENSVLGMGVYLGQSTPIFNRDTGEISYAACRQGSVVVSGGLPKQAARPAYSLYCAVIVKTVDAQTRSKTSINDLLRP